MSRKCITESPEFIDRTTWLLLTRSLMARAPPHFLAGPHWKHSLACSEMASCPRSPWEGLCSCRSLCGSWHCERHDVMRKQTLHGQILLGTCAMTTSFHDYKNCNFKTCAPKLPESRSERILFRGQPNLSPIFREISCAHFSWKLKDENQRKISPFFRRIFRPSRRKNSPEFRSRSFSA